MVKRMSKVSPLPSSRRQSGVSLVEVLVAILVVALGILTMVVMQVNATKLTKSTEVRAMGALLVGDLADRMRANRIGFLADNYQTKESAATPEVFTKCTAADATCEPDEMARQDLSDWLTSLRYAMPGGSARISTIDTSKGKSGVDVWLMWIDPEEQGSNQTAGPSECPGSVAIAAGKAPVRCMYFRINV